MTRLVLVGRPAMLAGFDLRRDDVLVPLRDSAAEVIAGRGWAERMFRLPESPVLGRAARAEAFETAQRILAALDQDRAWHALLRYAGHDLRDMALKNVYFELEWLAGIRERVRLAAEALPGAEAALLDNHLDAARAVRSILPGAAITVSRVRSWRVVGEDWAKPVVRWGLGRWAAWPRRAERTEGRPVVCFMDGAHRAVAMARTLALVAQDRPVMIAQMNRFAWPRNVALRPDAIFPWGSFTPRGAGWRTARHVLNSTAGTDPVALGIPGCDWIPARLLWGLRFDDVQRYAQMIEAFSGLAAALDPALWITLEDEVAFGKCAASVGERQGVPTVNVQQGNIGAYPYRTGADVVGVYAVVNDDSRRVLADRGADAARIVVTGPVGYDELSAVAAQLDRAAWLRAHDLDPGQAMVLFASQRAQRLINQPIKRRALRSLVTGAAHVGAQVVITAHPFESVPKLRALVREVGGSGRVVEDSFDQWLAACDVLATISSSAVCAAAVIRRPAMLLTWSGNADAAQFIADGIALQPAQPDQTGAVLASLLQDDRVRAHLQARQKAFVAGKLPLADGGASGRLAALINRLIAEANDDRKRGKR